MNVIYLGASLVKDGVMANQLFTRRPAELIARLSEKYSLIENLFIDVNELPAARLEIRKAGSLLNLAFLQTKGGAKIG